MSKLDSLLNGFGVMLDSDDSDLAQDAYDLTKQAVKDLMLELIGEVESRPLTITPSESAQDKLRIELRKKVSEL